MTNPQSPTERLRRFWDWHDAEKPNVWTKHEMLAQNVPHNGRYSLWLAMEMIRTRAGGFLACHDRHVWEKHPAALRDLSLSLCEALDRMHEQVPDGRPKAGDQKSEDGGD